MFDCRQKNKHNFGEAVTTETIVSLIYLFFIGYILLMFKDTSIYCGAWICIYFHRWHKKISPLHPGAIPGRLKCAHINDLNEK